MIGTGILESSIEYKQTSKKSATHFVLCNRDKIRYFISLEGGKKRLAENISSYSKKLFILLKIIRFIPFKLMELLRLGYFTDAKLDDEISKFIDNKNRNYWNVIVGTYDDKQKIVIQLWNNKRTCSTYYKVGNIYSNKEMLTEIDFLNENNFYKTFKVPKIIKSQKINNNNKFNIQSTEEFVGSKVEPYLTNDIYEIFKEIVYSKGINMIDDIPYGFSHGDLAPWNLKKIKNEYVLFDWEHCGIRFYGFDLIHYVFQVENLLNGKSKEESIDSAINQILKIDKDFKNIDRNKLKNMYFEEVKITYGE